ncbi:MAG: isoprenylcysteine carboxylmethyltransferase family protein [candidate division FCPU426 bacterium]
MLRRALQIIITFGIWAGLLFIAAGTWDWPRAWILVGLMVLTLAVNFVLVARFNPRIAEARSKVRKGTKGWDKVLMPVYAFFYLAFPVLAGLDAVRFGWTSLPDALVYPGAFLYIMGAALIDWVLVTNPFLEQTVRIQTERGHKVVTTGPYALVRHPMYCGLMIQYLGLPLLLGSAWSLLGTLAVIAIFAVRTAKEDKTLEAELEGYADYKQKTKWRLLMGVW